MKKLNLLGQKFGKLLVTKELETIKRGSTSYPQWLCICDCGREKISTTQYLRHGNINSCGCLVAETNRALRLGKNNPHTSTHKATSNNTRTPEYVCWLSMRQRCTDVKHSNYRLYGGNGITVCQAWSESFESFLADMGNKPSAKHSLDRIDSNGNYEKTNCRWATTSIQQNNRKNNRMVTLNGDSMTASQAATLIGVPSRTFLNRLKKFDEGLISESSLFSPAKRRLQI